MNLLAVVAVLCFPNVYGGYWETRENIIKYEKTLALGGNITLTAKEKECNSFIIKLKNRDYMGYDDDKFLPAKHFTAVKSKIDDTMLFKFIKLFPKGASLHTHLFAAASLDYLIKNVTYRESLFLCHLPDDRIRLKFLPMDHNDVVCEWKLVADLRKKDNTFDVWLKSKLSLVGFHKGKHEMWKAMSAIFSSVYDLLTYKPVFTDYVYQALTELYDDNVLYAEFKGYFVQLYNLDGSHLEPLQTLTVFRDVVEQFKTTHTKFIGAKYIFAISRHMHDDVQDHIKLLREAKRKYPDVVSGFDLVGFEDAGDALRKFVDDLTTLDKNIRYYFHAGETNWHGTHADENILDAILLRASRIGHAFSLYKHPEYIQLIKRYNIAIEVCPISNQVLRYVDDLRNHPATMYIANGLPVVICNDDPSLWGASGLQYDWYVAFTAMTRNDAGLETLKELALNSIWYSGMDKREKEKALQVFQVQWDEYIAHISAIFLVMKSVLHM